MNHCSTSNYPSCHGTSRVISVQRRRSGPSTPLPQCDPGDDEGPTRQRAMSIRLIPGAARGDEKQMGVQGRVSLQRNGSNPVVKYPSLTFFYVAFVIITTLSFGFAVLFAPPPPSCPHHSRPALFGFMLLSFTLPRGLAHMQRVTLITVHYSPTKTLYFTMSTVNSWKIKTQLKVFFYFCFLTSFPVRAGVFSCTNCTVGHRLDKDMRRLAPNNQPAKIRSAVTRDHNTSQRTTTDDIMLYCNVMKHNDEIKLKRYIQYRCIRRRERDLKWR